MIKGNSQKLPNGSNVFEGTKNKIDSSYRDLKEAYERGEMVISANSKKLEHIVNGNQILRTELVELTQRDTVTV